MSKPGHSSSVSSEQRASRSSSKSVRWFDEHEMINVMEIEEGDKSKSFIQNANFFCDANLEDELIENEFTPTQSFSSQNQDPLNLIEDTFTDSTIENAVHAVQLASENVQSSALKEEDEERQAALQELVTHLEDTASLLRQYMAPPNNSFVDNLSKSEKTHFLLKYLLVFVVFSQLLSILILSIFDQYDHGDGYTDLKKAIGVILQGFNMTLVVFASVVLSRQMLKYKVEGSFLAQTYVATVITFAGLYFIIYRFKPDSWEFGSIDKMEESIAIAQYIKMTYLSVSAATLCGAANIQPRAWYAIIILCFQSLINFVYFASILAQTIGNYNSYTVQVRRSNSMSVVNRKK